MWEGGLEEVEEESYTERGKPQRESLLGTTDSSIDQQHRMTFCASKQARSSYNPAIFMDSGLLVDTSQRVLKEGSGCFCGG